MSEDRNILLLPGITDFSLSFEPGGHPAERAEGKMFPHYNELKHFTSIILTMDTVVWMGTEKPLHMDYRLWLKSNFLWMQANNVCSQCALLHRHWDTGKVVGLLRITADTLCDDKTSWTLQKSGLYRILAHPPPSRDAHFFLHSLPAPLK